MKDKRKQKNMQEENINKSNYSYCKSRERKMNEMRLKFQ